VLTRDRPNGDPVTDILIRPATTADAADIARIYNQAVEHTTATFDTEPQTVEARLQWLAEHDDPRHAVLVAETPEGRIAGWASLSEYSAR